MIRILSHWMVIRILSHWMVIRILSHWMGYFLPLSVSDSIWDVARVVYLELSSFLIGGIRLDLYDELLYRELSYFPC